MRAYAFMVALVTISLLTALAAPMAGASKVDVQVIGRVLSDFNLLRKVSLD